MVDGFELPEGKGATPETILFESAVEFEGYFGVAPPPSIGFPDERALFHTVGARPIPGPLTAIEGIEQSGSTLTVATTLREPGEGCEVLGFTRPAWTLVSIEDPGVTAPSLVVTERSSLFDCARDGVGYWEECSDQTLCGADLICTGLTRWDQGWCGETWMWGTFDGPALSVIPDGDTAGLRIPVEVSGLASVDMDVIIYLELTHESPSDLFITLTNPATNEVVVFDQEPAEGPDLVLHRTPRGFSGDESVNGTWWLKVVDGTSGGTGTVDRWSLEITSRWD